MTILKSTVINFLIVIITAFSPLIIATSLEDIQIMAEEYPLITTEEVMVKSPVLPSIFYKMPTNKRESH